MDVIEKDAAKLRALLAEPTISVPAAGALFGLAKNASYRAAAEGTLPAIRVGPRRLCVPTAALKRMLDLDEPASAR
jgi:hypothetical protein